MIEQEQQVSAQEGQQEVLYTVSEVAKIFRIKEQTVRLYMKRGALPYVTLPREEGQRETYRIKKSDVDAVLKRR